jgi:diguanylate cyclase (GGDEF)-like protein/PAS domain S-box-containing protein
MTSDTHPPATILVVDDVPENLRLLTRELQQHGYEVRGVLTGKMALTVAHSTPVDLILLDVRLPDMDGYEVCQQLKRNQSTASIPIIFISALDEPLDKAQAFAVGGSDYITKPLKTIEVIARIKTQLSLVQARLQLQQFNQDLEAQVQQRTTELAQANQALHTEVQTRQQVEAELRASEARYRLIADHMSDLVCLHQADGTLQYVSPSCQALLGYDPEALYGQNLLSFCHPDDVDLLRQCFQPPTAPDQLITSCYRLRCQAGHYIWLETLARPLSNDATQVTGVVTSSRDVTQRLNIEEQLRYDALHDSLTGLPNRNWLSQQLDLELVRCRRQQNCQFGLLMLDLDQFKSVNDTLGHLMGDQLLIAVAERLQGCLRETDVIVRIGGDEFVVLLENTGDVQEAIQVASRVKHSLQTPFNIQGRILRTSASIGILINNDTYSASDDLLRDVDIALYQAKEGGRDRYEVFGTDMFQMTLKRVNLENDLHSAIDQHQFVNYYQPIYALPDYQLIGFEALVRWAKPGQDLILPGEFIDLAEETGLIVAMTQQVIQQTCEAIQHWQHHDLMTDNLRIAINISGQSFRDPELLTMLDQNLQKMAISPQCLTLEITERILLEQSSNILDTLTKIKQRGIRLSIDDFGTGYSSLKYLSKFPIDILKIDKSFVDEMTENSHSIVRTIVELAQNLNMSTVAEGAEDERQVQELTALGCDAVQGYFFSPALSLAAATKLLADLDLRQSG